jgi:hypothetical protein
VWNAPATDGKGIFFTTGNVQTNEGGTQPGNFGVCGSGNPKPNPNHGLSMIKVDPNSGNVLWPFSPVPFEMDWDPDWAAGATVINTKHCGEVVASVQKDGWTWALDATRGPHPHALWAFPTGPWLNNNGFHANDGTFHGDDDYRRPGAAWNDVFLVRTGGESLVPEGVVAGYNRLHALNACAQSENDRVLWIADNIPSGSFGAPSVTNGIVFVGTGDGQLLVFADPQVAGPAAPGNYNCSHPDSNSLCTCTYAIPAQPLSQAQCTAMGFSWVSSLQPLTTVKIPDGGSLASVRSEPVLSSEGRVFVATSKGHVFMLAPRK